MRLKKQRIYSGNIAVDVFYDKDLKMENIDKAIVIVHGFPDFVGSSALTSHFVQKKLLVFQPHIEGTYDSSGFFSPMAAKNTFELLNIMLNTRQASDIPNGEKKMQPWHFNKLFLAGHSFGGILLLRYFTCFGDILSGILFTSPALHYASKYGCKEIGPEHYENVRSKYPYTYRLAPIDAWNGILHGTDSIPNRAIGYVKKVQIIYGNQDKYFDTIAVQNTALDLVSKYIKADSINLSIVKNSGHSSAELLKQNEAILLINNFLK